jgi:predicted transcriptional regulator
MTYASQIALGMNNRARVLNWLRDHPGGTNRECAAALGMNVCVIGRHVKAIRKTWETPS